MKTDWNALIAKAKDTVRLIQHRPMTKAIINVFDDYEEEYEVSFNWVHSEQAWVFESIYSKREYDGFVRGDKVKLIDANEPMEFIQYETERVNRIIKHGPRRPGDDDVFLTGRAQCRFPYGKPTSYDYFEVSKLIRI